MPPYRYVYNDSRVKIYKEKKIKALNAKIKKLNETYAIKIRDAKRSKKKFKNRDLNLLSLSRAFSIINGPENLKTEKETKIEELGKKIGIIKNMTLKKYIEYRESLDKKKFEEEKKDKNEEDIIIENNIKKLEKMIKNDEKINYNLEDEETSVND